MDPIQMTIISLLGLAQLFDLQGLESQANTLRNLVQAYRSGANVEDHMKEVVEKLEAGDIDWDDLNGRIFDEVNEFLSRDSSGD